MNNYLTDYNIITQLCKERIKLAGRRDKQQYLTRKIGGRAPRVDANELDGLLPSRRQWSNFRPRTRSESSNPDQTALRHAVTVLRQQQPDLPWVQNLNRFIADTRERALGYHPFVFAKPEITWLPKPDSNVEFRALCLFPLQDGIISCLVAQYLRDEFDARFSSSSYAFRARNAEGRTPTHHDAFNRLYELKRATLNQEFYVAECDIRGFFDTVDHAFALAAFDRVAKRLSLHPRARQIVKAYLDSYSFKQSVLTETEPQLKQWKGANAHFPWPKEALVDLDSRILGMPQGGALSGVIANLVLDDADKAVEKCSTDLKADIHYYRYCDDMILLSPNQKHCEQVFNAYLTALEKIKLPYHLPATTNVYDGTHWKKKSKAPYCWSGRQWFGCVPWIQFVGYQLRYDGLVRARKGAFKSQAEKFVAVTDKTKFGLWRAGKKRPIRASRFQVLRSFAHKLTVKGVGIVAPYVTGPRPMSWSNGFKGLHEKPLVTTDLKRLDSLRQRQIMRFADTEINYGPERSSSRGWNPTGYWQSYFARLKDVGGRHLINNPWRPRDWKEKLQSFYYTLRTKKVRLPRKQRLAYRKLKLRIKHLFKSKVKIEVGENWTDCKFRRDQIYEVLKVGWLVKCLNFQTNQIRYIPRVLFKDDRFVKLTDKQRRFVGPVRRTNR